MYEDFFRLAERPFPSVPRIELYFPASAAENAHQTLARCIGRAEGPGLLIGGAGTGKSLLCHLLAARFRDAFHVVMLTSARLCTRRALLQNVLFELGLPYRGLEEGELRLSLIDFLKLDDSNREGVLLLVDEAHTLPLRLVEEIRMITNSLHEGQPSVRLVLVGGAALEERLASPKLESLNQRIAARCYLQPFTYEETFEYVRSQIATVGGDPAQVFTEDALAAVHHATDGIPRLVNQICDHALVLAVVNEREQVDARLIEEAWADLQQLPAPWQGPSTEAFGDEGVIEFGALDEPEFQEPNEEESIAREPVAESEDIDLTSQLNEIETCVAQVEEDAVAPPELGGVEETGDEVLSQEETALDAEMCVEPRDEEIPVESTDDEKPLEQSDAELRDEPTDQERSVEPADEYQLTFEPAQEPSVPQTNNPFEESFGDEEIVVDHYARLHTASQSVPAAASGNQDYELAVAADAILQGADHEPPSTEDRNGEPAVVEPEENADATIPSDTAFNEVIVQADREFEGGTCHIEDIDEQDHEANNAVCELDNVDEPVPVPVQATVMRVPPPDDSDLIVVVDEEFNSGQTSGNLGGHRQDYRRLFSKLRQT